MQSLGSWLAWLAWLAWPWEAIVRGAVCTFVLGYGVEHVVDFLVTDNNGLTRTVQQ